MKPTTAASFARRVGVAIVGCLLLVTLLAATVCRQVSCSLRDPSSLADTVATPAVVDHAYDVVLPAAWRDRIGSELVIEPLDAKIRLPDETPAIVRDFLESVWSRQVAREQISEIVTAAASAVVSGEASAPVPFGPARHGWSALPGATQALLDRLAIDEQVGEQVAAPLLRARTNDVLGPVLGVSLSDVESRAAALRIWPSAWVRAQVVTGAHAIVPYVSGVVPGFAAVVELRSRGPVALEVLHEQIVQAHGVRGLVFDHVLDPLIEERVTTAGPLPLGIRLSAAEIRATILASIPPGWFARKTWIVLTAFSSYVTGESDAIAFTIPLAERNDAFGRLLFELVRSKLVARLEGLPPCSRKQLFAAVRALRQGRLPLCVPGTASIVLELAVPQIESEITRVVQRLPPELALKHEHVSERLGPVYMASLAKIRARVLGGVVWTEEDLKRLLGGTGDSARHADVEETLAAVRRGTVSVPDLDDLAAEAAYPRMRQRVALGMAAVRHPWFLEMAALAWLAAIAALQTGARARRLQTAAWASTIVAVIAATLLVVPIWPGAGDVAAWMTTDTPTWSAVMTALAEGPLPIAIAEWAGDLRTNAALALVPWMLVGPFVHVVDRYFTSRPLLVARAREWVGR